MKPRILVVDDEDSLREFLQIMLQRENYEVSAVADGEKALKLIDKVNFDLIITDLQMPKVPGMQLLAEAKERDPDQTIIVITAFGSPESAVEAMKMGAYDYITKPFKIDEIKLVIKKALERRTLKKENLFLKKEVSSKFSFSNIIGSSAIMLKIYDLIQRVAQTKTNILITGESGTGKELVAKAIHYNGPLNDKPFVTVNCGAIPETLMESEMFGHKKGSFTGAISEKVGLFQVADGGSIFLDEVGEIPLGTQVKLLRIIQEKSFRKVGGTDDIKVDVRIIAATNKDLAKEVEQGKFREDLYYRLNVIQINTPPLRDRREDIPILAAHFLEKYDKELSKNIKKISKEAMGVLMDYYFPGNVRELENIIERAVALEPGAAILPESLPPNLFERKEAAESLPRIQLPPEGLRLEKVVADFEKEILNQALKRAGGVKKKAAKFVGLSFRSMRYRLRKYGLE